MSNSLSWPILKKYDQDHLLRIAMPLGGIGTGTVSLGGRGNLQDWEIVNRPAKGFAPRYTFFSLFVKAPGQPAFTRILEGPIHPSQYEGARGCTVPNHGLPHFQSCTFSAAYPLAQVHLSEKNSPVDVRLEALTHSSPEILTAAESRRLCFAMWSRIKPTSLSRPRFAAACKILSARTGLSRP